MSLSPFPSAFGAGASGFPGNLQKRGKAVVAFCDMFAIIMANGSEGKVFEHAQMYSLWK